MSGTGSACLRSLQSDGMPVLSCGKDPTGYKWELIQRPDHKKDPILHVRQCLCGHALVHELMLVVH